MKKWFYAMVAVFVMSFTCLGITGYALIMVVPVKKKEWMEVGVKLSPTQQAVLDISDFWVDWAWVFALVLVWPSLLASIVLGIILLKRRISAWLW